VNNVGPNNGLAESRLAFSASDVVGFRAPYLAKGAGLYGALKANGFRYDTSGVGYADAWPERIDGIWRFNLAMLRIQGSGKGTLSMDYNFFVAQSRAATDPRRYEAAREQRCRHICTTSKSITRAIGRRSTLGTTSPAIRAAPTTRRSSRLRARSAACPKCAA